MFPTSRLVRRPYKDTLHFPYEIDMGIRYNASVKISRGFLRVFQLYPTKRRVTYMNITRHIRVGVLGPFRFLLYHPTRGPCHAQHFVHPIYSRTSGKSFLMILQSFLYPLRTMGLMVNAPFFLCLFMMIRIVGFPMTRAIFTLFYSHHPRSYHRHITRVGNTSFTPLYHSCFNYIPYPIVTRATTCHRVLFLGIGVLPDRTTGFPSAGPHMMHCLRERRDEVIFYLRGFLRLLRLFVNSDEGANNVFLTIQRGVHFLLPTP